MAPPSQKALPAQVRSSLVWSVTNNVVAKLATLGVGIVLARLLTPRDFGLFAVAMVAFTAVSCFDELGVSLALVRWPGDVRTIAPTVATLALASSGLLFTACFALAPSIARALGAPSAGGIVRLMAVAVLVDGITQVPVAMLQREFRQDRKMLADVVALVISTVVSIGLAVTGHGAWSLAWGRLAGNTAGAVMFVMLAPMPLRFGFDARIARSLLAFGLPLAGSSLLTFAVLNVDYVVVGVLLGPVALGVYVLAFNISSWSVNVLSSAVRSVSLAGFSRLAEDDTRGAAPAAFTRSLGWLFAIAAPIGAGLVVFGPTLIRFVYGARWTPAGVPLRLLAVVGVLRVCFELAYDYLVAVGRPRILLFVQGAWLVALIPTLTAGAARFGVAGVAGGHVVVAIAVVTPAYIVGLRRAGVSLPRARQLARAA
jgi:PST family polysaccharide transporter